MIAAFLSDAYRSAFEDSLELGLTVVHHERYLRSMDIALMWLAAAVAFTWNVLSSPVTIAILLLLILATLREQNATLLGIYRRLHLRARQDDADNEDEDCEEEHDDPDSAPIDELMHEEIEMRAGRLPRPGGMITKAFRRLVAKIKHG